MKVKSFSPPRRPGLNERAHFLTGIPEALPAAGPTLAAGRAHRGPTLAGARLSAFCLSSSAISLFKRLFSRVTW